MNQSVSQSNENKEKSKQSSIEKERDKYMEYRTMKTKKWMNK